MNKNFLFLSLLVAISGGMIQAKSEVQSECSAQKGCAKLKCNGDCSTSKNTWLPRAFSSYSTRGLMMEKPLFQTDVMGDKYHGIFSMATEYMQNFGQKCNSCKNLGAMPFWSGTNTMTVGNNLSDGSNLDAYQFGLGDLTLGTDESGNPVFGTITLDPRVQHVGTDFLLYFTQHKDARGLFFKLNAPLGAMIIDTRPSETGIVPDGAVFHTVTDGEETFDDALNLFYPLPSHRYDSLIKAFMGGAGCCSDKLDGNIEQHQQFNDNFGDFLELQKGRIHPGRHAAIRLSDISLSLGYNVWANDKGLLGVAFKGTCPTGNMPTGDYMLEPIFGRAGAWGIGAEVMGHYKVWENDAQTRFLDVWLQSEVLHLMPGKRINYRSFDLKGNGPGSKYLLVQEYVAGVTAAGVANRTAGVVQQAVNLTTLPVISKIKAEGSVALGFDFHCNNWNAALIGEFWGRTKEVLSIDMCAATSLRLPNLNDYAVLGRQVSSYVISSAPGVADMNLTEPAAKICHSQDAYSTIVPFDGVLTTAQSPFPDGIEDATDAANRIPSKLEDALDIEGAAASRAFTGKITGQLGYTFSENRYAPYIAIFGGAELTPRCSNNAMQYWSVGIQGSLNF